MRGPEYVEIAISPEVFDLLPIEDRRAINGLKRKVLWRYMCSKKANVPEQDIQNDRNADISEIIE